MLLCYIRRIAFIACTAERPLHSLCSLCAISFCLSEPESIVAHHPHPPTAHIGNSCPAGHREAHAELGLQTLPIHSLAPRSDPGAGATRQRAAGATLNTLLCNLVVSRSALPGISVCTLLPSSARHRLNRNC
ncbi:hypothetical protein K437DRAFT_78336 [Tilletiaria anomala UBC 951]|uniref:Uncharacterized protein n=1 Tax=Tilletiaria anomala (strain ATCC 24038 / CBS 436.72 / UBC 951) TaxID=1037660 RepID=A0A066V555_TILAU|nr:uncharacterized protein K437DRAFT_78336 [Tilletiaria anomala UBC 951]KDN35353.1 hypothetical protein K437DRAFT_78336 [Tilletiaria anomala UBC 951]